MENNDQPLHTLLQAFGNIIPQLQSPWSPFSHPTKHEDEEIDASLICFCSLTEVGSVKIKWVDSLCFHLELDRHRKILQLFRLPLVCLLMCCCDELPLLSQYVQPFHLKLVERQAEVSRLLADSAMSSMGWVADTSKAPHDARHFYREVLLTYRLLFGQDQDSYKAFNRVMGTSVPFPEQYRDPLLPILCGKSWKSEAARNVYELLEADDPASSYDLKTEFPFFGERILEIQRFARARNPETPGLARKKDSRKTRWWISQLGDVHCCGAPLRIAGAGSWTDSNDHRHTCYSTSNSSSDYRPHLMLENLLIG